MFTWTRFAAVGMAAMLAGCNTMEPLVSSGGPGGGANKRTINFLAMESASRSDPTSDAAARAMLTTGYQLIRSNCDDYFASAGDYQRWINFGRDATVATAAVVTATVGYNPRNKKILGVIPIATSGVYTGIDLYNKDFLFAAENIDAVKTLIMNAVSTHQALSQTQISGRALTYGEALVMLQDDQAYCMPPKIVPLVRAAIKSGQIVQVGGSAPAAPDTRTADQMHADDAVLKTLGTELNPPGALSFQQAAVLYWLFKRDSTTAERTAMVKLLGALPADSQPLDAQGKMKSPWPHKDAVEKALDGFSPQTLAKIDQAVVTYRKDLSDKARATAQLDSRVSNLQGVELEQLRQNAAAEPLFPSFAPAASSVATPVVVDVR
jgi:hypothetical protein